MDELLSLCKWTDLQAPYQSALQEAVAFILRGNPGPSSDLDIYMIHTRGFFEWESAFEDV